MTDRTSVLPGPRPVPTSDPANPWASADLATASVAEPDVGRQDAGGATAEIHSFLAHLERRSARLRRPAGPTPADPFPDGRRGLPGDRTVRPQPGASPDPYAMARRLHPAGRGLNAQSTAPSSAGATTHHLDARPAAGSGDGGRSRHPAMDGRPPHSSGGSAAPHGTAPPSRAATSASALATAALAPEPRRHLAPLPVDAEARRPALVVLPEPSGHVRARRRSVGLLVIYVALLTFAVLFAGVVMHASLAQQQSHLDGLRDREAAAEREHQVLRLRVTELESPSRIVSLAARLDMHVPAAVTYLEPVPADTPSTAASGGGQNAPGAFHPSAGAAAR